MQLRALCVSLLMAGSLMSTTGYAARQCPAPGDVAYPVVNITDPTVVDPCGPVGVEPGNPVSSNSNEDACGAVLCLAGAALSGEAPTSCDKYIRKYFEQQVFSNGSFDPSKTFKARRSFLDQCKSSDESTRGSVNDKYGNSGGM